MGTSSATAAPLLLVGVSRASVNLCNVSASSLSSPSILALEFQTLWRRYRQGPEHTVDYFRFTIGSSKELIISPAIIAILFWLNPLERAGKNRDVDKLARKAGYGGHITVNRRRIAKVVKYKGKSRDSSSKRRIFAAERYNSSGLDLIGSVWLLNDIRRRHGNAGRHSPIDIDEVART